MRNRLLIAVVIVLMMFATTAFAQTSQTINLKTGFNFVSFTATISLTPAQFKTNYTQVDDIYLFSAAAGSFLSANDGSLTSLSAGKGYIIKSKSDGSITISGSALATFGNITLKKGFNLIGFSKVPQLSATFSQIMTTYGQIHGMYKWIPASGSFIQVVRNITNSQVTQLDGADPSFKAGDSYFINVDRDTTINYEGSTMVVGDGSTVPYTPPAQTEINGVPVQFLTDITDGKTGVGDIAGEISASTSAPSFDIDGRLITIKSISNIKVWVKDHPEINTQTDENGKFTLKDVPAAAKGQGHTLEYEKTEGNDKFKGVITDVPAVEKKKVDLKAYIGPQVIKPSATIQGKVALSDGLSPIGADVYIPGISGMVAKVDEDGSFSLMYVPVGTYTVAFQYYGYQLIKQNVTVQAAEFKQLSTVVLNKITLASTLCSVDGYVTDSANAPVISTNVSLISSDAKTDIAVVTSTTGHFQFKGLAAGTYKIIFAKEGYKGTEQSVTLTAGQEKHTNQTLEKVVVSAGSGFGMIGGYVKDQTGAPLRNAVVMTIPPTEQFFTDNNGFFTLLITPGDYTFVVKKAGFKEDSTTCKVFEDQVTEVEAVLENLDTTVVASLTLNMTELTVKQGESYQLVATPKDASGNILYGKPITWTSSSATVGTVSPTGLFTANAAGTCVITAKSGTVSATANLTVASSTVSLTKLELFPATVTLKLSEIKHFSLVATFSDGQVKLILPSLADWSATGSQLYTQDKGAAMAIAAGTSTLTAAFGGMTASSTVTVGSVTIDDRPPLINHMQPAIEAGKQLVISANVTDNIGVAKVSIYFKKPEDASYQNADMAKTGEVIYTYAIPAALITASGIQYYIKAEDTKTPAPNVSTFPANGVNYPIVIKPLILSELILSRNVDTVAAGAVYDLTLVNVLAKYTPLETVKLIKPVWSVKTGGGTIAAGGSYTAPAAAGTAVLTATYIENGVTKTADLTLTVTAVAATIQSVGTLADKNVANGTALTAVGLPATVSVTMSDATTKDVAVTWDGGTPAYSATTAGTYTFSGTIADTTLKASIKVIVAEVTAATIQSIPDIPDKNVLNGTALTGTLPANVLVVMSDSTTKEVAVTWDGGTPAYSATTAGTYTFSGTVAGTTLKASIKVIVAEATTATIQSISSIPDKNVANGTTLTGASLPANVLVVMSDATTKEVAVTWDGGTPAYNATTAGTYTFSGTVAGTTLKASIKVIVAEAATGPTIQSIATIADKNVDKGTGLSAAGLPAKVVVTMSDATTKEVDVTWDGGTPAYNAATAGTYTFSGTIANTTLKASVNVIVSNTELPADVFGIYKIEDLYAIRGGVDGYDTWNLSKKYKLMADLDFNVAAHYKDVANSTTWTTGAGWDPIGNKDVPFGGTFDGNGHSISNMIIVSTGGNKGLFGGNSGTIKNINLINPKIQNDATSLAQNIGGLVGYNNGIIMNSSVSGTSINSVIKTSNNVQYAGGLVGFNDLNGSITDSYTNIKVEAAYCSGGLIGRSNSTVYNGIARCHASGNISSTNNYIGGLIGYIGSDYSVNTHYLIDSYATGSVTAGHQAGGLIGGADGKSGSNISNCYATGKVTANGWDAGGLIGKLQGYVTINSCHAIGDVTGESSTGGLIGQCGHATLNNCYATGKATGSSGGYGGDGVGGFIGTSFAKLSDCYSTGNASGLAQIGGFIGYCQLDEIDAITNCYATGNAVCTGVNRHAGGFIGYNKMAAACYIDKCYAIGVASNTKNDAGGLIGVNESVGSISNCYAVGDVAGNYNAGGFIGRNIKGDVSNSYAAGAVTSSSPDTESGGGGFIGRNDAGSISKCYAFGVSVTKNTVAASNYFNRIAGRCDTAGLLSDNYANTDMLFILMDGTQSTTFPGLVSASATTKRGAHITLVEAKTQAKYVTNGWNFDTTWKIAEGVEYPKLKWQQ